MAASAKMPYMPGLGEYIARLRKEAKLSRSALARAARVDPSILVRLESGDRAEVRLETLCRLADSLGVTLDDLATAAGLRPKRRGTVNLTGASEVVRLRSALERIMKIANGALEIDAPKKSAKPK